MVIFGALSAAAGAAKSVQNPAKRLSVSVEIDFIKGGMSEVKACMGLRADCSAIGFSGER